MTVIRRIIVMVAILASVMSVLVPTANAKGAKDGGYKGKEPVRFATFNASMNRNSAGELLAALEAGDDPQIAAVAETIQRTRPAVLLLNEFDYDPTGAALELFQKNYLSVGQNGAKPISYGYTFMAPSNTGVPSGLDLDNSGDVGGPGDAFGFGFFEGQFGMAVLSQHPIATHGVRTFQKFLWKDMPGALLPDDPETDAPADWYSPEELGVFRLSSKSHWDVPIKVNGRWVHFLVSHPTPPVFDGPEDRNGTRNHDEIRFWADYVRPRKARYIYDDNGKKGGLYWGARFVIAGDQNADPFDGDSTNGAINQLLDLRKVRDPKPASEGGAAATERQGGVSLDHVGDPALDTGDFNPAGPGNLRVDYVLPHRRLRVADAGVFWLTPEDDLFRLTADFPDQVSDHRLVWVDLEI